MKLPSYSQLWTRHSEGFTEDKESHLQQNTYTYKTEKNKEKLELRTKRGITDTCGRNSEEKRRPHLASGVRKEE